MLLLLLLIGGGSYAWGETKTGSWDLTKKSAEWTASGNVEYFKQPYGFKKANGTLTNKSIADFSIDGISQIKVGFKCLRNGNETSELTIWLVDKDGKTLGDGVVVTPDNQNAASKTTYQYATFTTNLEAATGFMMKVTKFGKSILVNGAQYEVEYSAAPAANLTSIAVSGTPTKTTYEEGETFDPTGLVVTATYEDESTEVVTGRVKWTFNPEILAVGTTSVEVMASIGSDAITDVYVVNGITVKEKMILVGNSIVVAEDTKNSKWVAMSTSNKETYFEAVDLVKVGDKYITTEKLDDILFYVNTVDGKTSIQNPADDKYVQATGEKKVSYTEKEYLWSNNGEQLAAAQTAHGTLQYNVAAPRFTTYAKKVGQYATIVDKSNVYEGAVIALSGTDGTHYFTTFSSDKAVEFVDATVYTVGVNENKLSLNEVKGNQVPANTGVLVQSNKTDAMYVYIESAPAIEGNLLRASVTEQTTTGADDTKEYKYYMLSYNKDNENLGFYWGENDGAAFTSKAGRAYLAVEKTNEVAAVKGFSLSDMETGISQVCGSAANNGVIYDLQGRRVERAVRGLYIMNGRKVMVK